MKSSNTGCARRSEVSLRGQNVLVKFSSLFRGKSLRNALTF